MNAFIHGFLSPFYGFKLLISDARLRALSIVPLLISILAVVLFTTAGLFAAYQLVNFVSYELGSLLALEPGGLGSVALTIVLWPACLLILGVGVYMTVRLIAAPFYSFLAEKTLVKLGTRRDQPFVLHRWVWISFRMLLISLAKSVLFAVASTVLLLFSLAPGLNIVVTIGFMSLVAFDISDYAFEAMEWPLKRRFRHVRTHWLTYSGLACGLGLVMALPGFNLILLPAAVIGASETLHRTLGTPVERYS